ncbi:hypothetical protein TNCV_3203371 [Trichonephila clavipes]|nr:hypothetical protein TNCV_3203371 [Trichonephila clavipes]
MVAKSPRAAEQCDVNLHSLTHSRTHGQRVVDKRGLFADGPRHFEPWSSDVDDNRAGIPLLTTISHQREDVGALLHVRCQAKANTLTTRLPRPL